METSVDPDAWDDATNEESAFLAWTGRILGSAFVHVLVLVVACFAVYGNAYDHDFHLDSGHVIKDNAAIRSLDNFSEFFTDPGTFTSLRANVDYRPLLVVSHAIDYALGEYDMAQWHRTQILMHVACVLGLYGFARLVLRRAGEDRAHVRGLIGFGAAIVFALHPTNCGVVDYISARSSMMTAAFLLPSILFYMVPVTSHRYARTQWLSALFYGLAIFTKVEAIGAIGVFLLYDVWQTAVAGEHKRGFAADVLRTVLRGTTIRRLWPIVVLGVGFLALRWWVMRPFDYGEASVRSDVTKLDYFRTQVASWWHYVARWFFAADLVADDTTTPILRSWTAPSFLAAAGAWGVVGAGLVGVWRRWPHLVFLTISALALISPTSSVLPLAEMVNEHRPYLPLAVLSLVWMIPLGYLFGKLVRLSGAGTLVAGVGFVVLLAGLFASTRARNEIFRNTETYWKDILDKAPHGRAHVNYGLTFMARGDFETALKHFEASLDTTPLWHITHTNLAIVHEELGNEVKAREHFDRAVEYDAYSGTALTYRAEYHLERKHYAEAAADFEASAPKSLEHYRIAKGLATACAGLGDGAGAYEQVRRCLELEPERLGFDIVPISTPFFEAPERAAAGVEFFESLVVDLPDTWWVHANLSSLLYRIGENERGDIARDRSESLKPAE